MAFSLGAWTKNGPFPFLAQPGGQGSIQPPTIAYHFELADQNATTSPVAQAPTGISWARAVVRQKGFVSGSGTIAPIYELEVAYDSGFTSQLRTIAVATMVRNGTNVTRDQTYFMAGVVPDDQSYTFARLAITTHQSDAVTVDYFIDLIPGI